MSDPAIEAAQRMSTAAHINRCFARSADLGSLELTNPDRLTTTKGKLMRIPRLRNI